MKTKKPLPTMERRHAIALLFEVVVASKPERMRKGPRLLLKGSLTQRSGAPYKSDSLIFKAHQDHKAWAERVARHHRDIGLAAAIAALAKNPEQAAALRALVGGRHHATDPSGAFEMRSARLVRRTGGRQKKDGVALTAHFVNAQGKFTPKA